LTDGSDVPQPTTRRPGRLGPQRQDSTGPRRPQRPTADRPTRCRRPRIRPAGWTGRFGRPAARRLNETHRGSVWATSGRDCPHNDERDRRRRWRVQTHCYRSCLTRERNTLPGAVPASIMDPSGSRPAQRLRSGRRARTPSLMPASAGSLRWRAPGTCTQRT
jgi:hypothetical protein